MCIQTWDINRMLYVEGACVYICITQSEFSVVCVGGQVSRTTLWDMDT